MTRFAVVACSACREPWAVETRHARVACPRCGQAADLATRQRLWEGDDAAQAQAEAGIARARRQGWDGATASLLRRPREARHDSPIEAAAAKGSAIRSKPQRAVTVAAWMGRLAGTVPHGDLVAALEASGLDRRRAEAEIVRMLATDYLFEPQAGFYQVLER